MEKEELEKLKKIPGKVRGVVFLSNLDYLKEKMGKEGVELLEKKMAEWGFPLKHKDLVATKWYPLSERTIFLLATKETFGWGKKEIFDLGNNEPKFSFIVRTLLRSFVSLSKAAKKAAEMWPQHYTVGKLTIPVVNEEKKYVVLRLEDFKLHPLFCVLHAGYFLRIAQYAIKSKKITIEETKCMFKGDLYHEFITRWI